MKRLWLEVSKRKVRLGQEFIELSVRNPDADSWGCKPEVTRTFRGSSIDKGFDSMLDYYRQLPDFRVTEEWGLTQTFKVWRID